MTAVKRIVDSQYTIPRGFPLPLLWPAAPDNRTAMARATPYHPASDADDSSSSDDSSQGDTKLDDLVRRLAVSKDYNFTVPPQLFKECLPEADAAANATPRSTSTRPNRPSWSYGNIYRVEYPEDETVDCFRESLAQKGLKLPEIVLDLGRLVVTSKRTTNPDGSNWSPSDYTVMVDMQSEGKAVWLVCDSHVFSRLRRLNYRDGTPWDLDRVRRLFDRRAMDLALLYPRIDDWESSKNTWTALQARISQTAVKLGLRLRNL